MKQSSAGSASKNARPPAVVVIPLGSRIEVYYTVDSQWYDGKVLKRRGSSSHYKLSFDDGTRLWLDLSKERFRKSTTGRAEKKEDDDDDKDDDKDDKDDEGENEFELDREEDDEEAPEFKDEPAINDGKTDDWKDTDDDDDCDCDSCCCIIQ
jgi:hypothetical protein